MNVVSVKASPENSVEPMIRFDANFEYRMGTMLPIAVTASVRTQDGKLLGPAHYIESLSPRKEWFLDAKEEAQGASNMESLGLACGLQISPYQLDYLDCLSDRSTKGDIVLNCTFQIHTVVSNTCISSVKFHEKIGRDEFTLTWKYDHAYNAPRTNMWLLSGDNSSKFLKQRVAELKCTVTISRSDWIHDFLSLWRSTRHLVLEVPQPEFLTSTAPLSSVAAKIKAAIESAQSATESLERGEWTQVVQHLRKVWELIRNDNDIENLLIRDGYTSDAAKALNDSIKKQFELASKFLHRVDRSGTSINPEIRASKEDAYLLYSFAMGVLNLIGQKTARIGI